MNPPFNDASDRRTPDSLKAEAHAMSDGLFEIWIKTAGAIMKPGGQLVADRPAGIDRRDIIAACGRRFGGIEITPLHPRTGENAVRILVTAIKQSRKRLVLRAPLDGARGGRPSLSPAMSTISTTDALPIGAVDLPYAGHCVCDDQCIHANGWI